MNIALLQSNFTVGDFHGNAQRIAQGVQRAAAHGADFCICSQLAVNGYPLRDLLHDRHFLEAGWQALESLARDLALTVPFLVGVAEPNSVGTVTSAFNCAALVENGIIRERFRKPPMLHSETLDGTRDFRSGSDSAGLAQVGGLRFGILWEEEGRDNLELWIRHADRMGQSSAPKADCLVILSASPFITGKQAAREAMLSELAAHQGIPVLYANQVGGNDDLVFAGRSMAFDATGRLRARAKSFEEDILLVDLPDRYGAVASDDFSRESEIWRALVLGTRDYVHKCGFQDALLGLSGGVDSALTAAIAVHALGADHVLGVLMPSPYSSQGSIDDSLDLAKRLRIRTVTLPIAPLMESFQDTLRDTFAGCPEDTTEENIQSRIRGSLLMALSNKYGAMLLATGNKSELAVGYCTIYGDMAGGLAVIADLPKILVYSVCRWLNQKEGEIIPHAVLEKSPSAELRRNQLDQDSLPPYDVLDAILERHILRGESLKDLTNAGFDEEIVLKVLQMIQSAEFKRKQAPLGIKVTDRTLGRDWFMPVARAKSVQ